MSSEKGQMSPLNYLLWIILYNRQKWYSFLLLSLVFPITIHWFQLLLTLSDSNASGWECQCHMPALSWIFLEGFRQSKLATSENEENNWGGMGGLGAEVSSWGLGLRKTPWSHFERALKPRPSGSGSWDLWAFHQKWTGAMVPWWGNLCRSSYALGRRNFHSLHRQ